MPKIGHSRHRILSFFNLYLSPFFSNLLDLTEFGFLKTLKFRFFLISINDMEIESLKVRTDITNIQGDITEIKTQLSGLIDLFYPVGSYYETSDITFYPSVEWGGTWEQDTKGYVTVGALTDGGDSPREGGLDIDGGVTMGEVEHTLTIEEMPSHTHQRPGNYWVQNVGYGNVNSNQVGDSANRANVAGDAANTGGGKAHNNIQPSIGVYRWHRTA